jgi:hypothetical protein
VEAADGKRAATAVPFSETTGVLLPKDLISEAEYPKTWRTRRVGQKLRRKGR